jgi:hypothetical protein
MKAVFYVAQSVLICLAAIIDLNVSFFLITHSLNTCMFRMVVINWQVTIFLNERKIDTQG